MLFAKHRKNFDMRLMMKTINVHRDELSIEVLALLSFWG
jgi:hypothetical protein